MLLGKVIDNYHLQSILGRGGMGIVYKAEDTTLEKIVALKMIDPKLSENETFLRRFRTEAKALAKLHDPNIVSVFALRDTEYGLCLIMEYVEGTTLAELMETSGTIHYSEVVPLMKQCLKAIGHAHKVGVIHRDIKPRNIMIADGHFVKVMDFGLARIEHNPDSTVTSIGGGTYKYMSPEQIKSMGSVDHRSDIYSLGMTFYEVLAGRTPFEDSDTEFIILKTIVEDRFPPPTKYNPSIPKPLVKIVMKAMEKDPKKRFQDASEMLDAIEKFEISDSKIRSEPYVSPAPRSRWPLYAAFFSVAVALVLVLVLFAPKLFRSANSPTPNTRVVEEPTDFPDPLQSAEDPNVNFEPGHEIEPEDEFGAFGSLEITSSPPEAEVFVDNLFLGRTPVDGNTIEAGEHNILIRKKEYRDFRKAIKVESGQTEFINAILKGLGAIKISSDPEDASVFLDGDFIGETPFEYPGIEEGEHELVLQKPGFHEVRSLIKVVRGQPTLISEELFPLTGSIKFRVIPWGNLYVDDVPVKAELDFDYIETLPVGSHLVSIKNPGLGVWEESVVVYKDSTYDIIVDFSKEVKFTVTSDIVNAQVFIDDKFSEKTTPQAFRRRIGLHKIGVRSPLDSSHYLEKKINLSEDRKEPINFEFRPIDKKKS